LLRDDPALAALCVERMPADVKGFRHAVKNYEVKWRTPDLPEDPEALSRAHLGTAPGRADCAAKRGADASESAQYKEAH
jgi:hypothetical protein